MQVKATLQNAENPVPEKIYDQIHGRDFHNAEPTDARVDIRAISLPLYIIVGNSFLVIFHHQPCLRNIFHSFVTVKVGLASSSRNRLSASSTE